MHHTINVWQRRTCTSTVLASCLATIVYAESAWFDCNERFRCAAES
jgi:hypothetical protein